MIKRTIDVVVSSLCLVLFFPLLLLIAMLVKLESGGPVFFISERVGRKGEPFPMLKFRTLLPQTGPVLPGQQSATRLGQLLRRTNLDELPQLLNVLQGQMSLTGPRPQQPGAIDPADPTWQQVLSVRPGVTNPKMAKRFFDVGFSFFWLVVTAPVILLIAVFIKLDSRGPIFYRPEVIGYGGKRFRMVRFRTMRAARSDQLTPEERLTRVGRVIRNYSLDHLPSLVNILNGEMSFIGPRPMEPERVDMTDPVWQRYFSVKPGLITLAVSKLARTYNASDMSRKQALELDYIEKQFFRFDLWLLIRAIRDLISSGGNVKARGEPWPDDSDREERGNEIKTD